MDFLIGAYFLIFFRSHIYGHQKGRLKELLQMANKWQKLDASRRRRIILRNNGSPIVANRGQLFVYTWDGKRFMIPIRYVNHGLFRELLRMSEEQFGLPCDGPITLPCDASCMKYIISLVRHGACVDVLEVVHAAIAGIRCLVSSVSETMGRTELETLQLPKFLYKIVSFESVCSKF